MSFRLLLYKTDTPLLAFIFLLYQYLMTTKLIPT